MMNDNAIENSLVTSSRISGDTIRLWDASGTETSLGDGSWLEKKSWGFEKRCALGFFRLDAQPVYISVATPAPAACRKLVLIAPWQLPQIP